MNTLDITLVRWIHALAGIVWFGVAFFAVVILHPFALKTEGGRFLRMWYAGSRMSRIFPIAAIVTTVGGLYVTGRLFVVSNGPWRDATAMNILYFGILVGLLAFGHGIGLGSQTAKYGRLSRAVLENGSATDEQQAELDKQERSLIRSSWISFGLTTVALLSMTLAPHL